MRQYLYLNRYAGARSWTSWNETRSL